MNPKWANWAEWAPAIQILAAAFAGWCGILAWDAYRQAKRQEDRVLAARRRDPNARPLWGPSEPPEPPGHRLWAVGWSMLSVLFYALWAYATWGA